MPDNLISLSQDKEEQTISLSETTSTIRPNSEVAQNRAEQYDYTMGEKFSPGYDTIHSNITSGDETTLREKFVDDLLIDEEVFKRKMLDDQAQAHIRGAPTTKEELDTAKALTLPSPRPNSNTIFERVFADKYINDTLSTSYDNEEIDEELATEDGQAKHDLATNVIMFGQLLKRLRQDAEEQAAQTSFGKTVSDTFETFVPLLEWYRISEVDTPFEEDAILPGKTIREKTQNIWRLAQADPEQAYEIAKQAYDDLNAKNIFTSVSFLRKLESYPATEEFLDNAFGVFDLGALTPIGTAVKAGKAVILGKALRDAVKAATGRSLNVGNILDEVGETVLSSQIQARQRVLGNLRGLNRERVVDDFLRTVPSLYNPRLVLSGATNFSREQTQQLLYGLSNTSKNLLNTLTQTRVVTRLNETQLNEALDVVRSRFNLEFPSVEDRILDIVPKRSADDSAANLDVFEISLGKEGAELFSSRQQANTFAKDLYGLSDYKIRQQGGKFYVSVLRTADETDPRITDLAIDTTTKMKDDSLINTVIGLYRTPKETLSKALNQDRLTATIGSQRLLGMMSDVAKNVGKLGISSRRRLKTFLKRQRDMPHPETGQRGYFSRNLGEFESAWHEDFKRFPTLKETTAYFTYVQLNDLDWVVRNLSLFRDKSRLGLNNYTFKYPVFRDKKRISMKETPQIEGKVVDDIPWANSEEAGVLVINSDGTAQLLRKNRNRDTLKSLTDDLKENQNYQVLQVSPNGETALKGIKPFREASGNGKINFVISQGMKSHGLKLQNIPYRPGGHVEYPMGFYVSQPRIIRELDENNKLIRSRYEGDTAILQFGTEAQANKFAKRIEEARKLLKGGKDKQLKAYLEANLPWSVAKFKRLFAKDGPLNLNDPVLVNFSGENTLRSTNLEDKFFKFFDSNSSSYNLYGSANLKYAGERDQTLPTIIEGSKNAPLYNLRPTELIDPITTATRAAASLIDNRFLDDVKAKSAQQFVKQFGDLFKNKAAAERNPIAALLTDPKQLLKDGLANSERLAAAKIMSRTTREFLHINTPEQRFFLRARQKLADSIYKTTGQKGVDLVHPYLMSTTIDPVSFARRMAFDTALGLFQPLQLFLQAQTLAHVAGVNGIGNAVRAMPATWMMLGLRRAGDLELKPQILDHFASLASKGHGWKANEFKESYKALVESGWMDIGGELAYIDDAFDPNLIQGKVGRFLDMGRTFFKTGERIVRVAAWNSAYIAWRRGNPLAKFTPKVQKDILERAQLLSVDMTADANAVWQKGLSSLPTQFFAYTARLAEQFTGKRLTGREKLRALGLYSAIYGVPVAAGIPLAAPFNDMLKIELLNRGIEYDDTVVEAFTDGLASLSLEWATGVDFDVSRYSPEGPSPLALFHEYFQGNKELWEILVGAAGTRSMQILESTAPFLHFISALMDGDDETNYPLTTGDVREIAASVASSFNNFSKTYMALQTGQYYSRKETLIDDTTPLEAVFIALTGLEPESREQAYKQLGSNKQLEDHFLQVSKEMRSNFVRMMRAIKDNDRSTVNAYAKRIKYLAMTVPPHKIADVMNNATRNIDDTLVNQAARRFWQYDPEVRLEPYIRRQEERQKELEATR